MTLEVYLQNVASNSTFSIGVNGYKIVWLHIIFGEIRLFHLIKYVCAVTWPGVTDIPLSYNYVFDTPTRSNQYTTHGNTLLNIHVELWKYT